MAVVRPSGNGKIIDNIIRHANISMSCIGSVHFGNPIDYIGVKVYPRLKYEQGYIALPGVILKEKPEYVVTINDIGLQLGYVKIMQKYPSIKWYPHVVVDSLNLPSWIPSRLKGANKVIVASEYGKKLLKKAGIDAVCIPNSVDTEVFKPQKNKLLLKKGFMRGKFIVLSVGINQTRKAWGALLEGFAKFAKDKSDVLLLLHTDMRPFNGAHGGWDLEVLIKELGLTGKCAFTDPQSSVYWRHDITPQMMAEIYNVSDVGLFAGAEGFGLCLTPNTMIQTVDGLKPIKNIKINDLVLTHKGHFKKVIKKHERKINEDVYEIYPYCMTTPITLTKEHPVYAIRRKTKQNHKTNWIKNPEWIKAGKLKKGDCVLFPYPQRRSNRRKKQYDLRDFDDQIRCDGGFVYYKMGYSLSCRKKQKRYKRFIDIDKELAFLVGWYAAEGSYHKGSIEFSLHAKEKGIAENIREIIKIKFGIEGKIYIKNNSLRLIFVGRIMGEFFSGLCGKGTKQKRLPIHMLLKTKELTKIMIKSLFCGDGHIDFKGEKNERHTLSTSSEQLANDVVIGLHFLGYKCQFGFYDRKKENMGIEYHVTYFPFMNNNEHSNKSWFGKGFNSYLIKEVKVKKYCGSVFNIEIAEDQSYTTQSFCVHNCTLETEACGKPVIVGDQCTAKELVGDHGLRVPIDHYLMGKVGVKQGVPSVEGIALALGKYYKDKNLMKRHGRLARKHALGYDVKVISKKWEALLK